MMSMIGIFMNGESLTCSHAIFFFSVLQCVAVCCSMLQYVVVCCSVVCMLQYVVVFCSVVQCVAVS